MLHGLAVCVKYEVRSEHCGGRANGDRLAYGDRLATLVESSRASLVARPCGVSGHAASGRGRTLEISRAVAWQRFPEVLCTIIVFHLVACRR